MSETILLKQNPRIEFQLLDNGFNLIDGETEKNSGFYAYDELQSIELNKPWFPRLRRFLRAFTWILNGVPLFPDAETCKKSNIILHLEKSKLGIWLTSTHMASKAKLIKLVLENKASKA